MRIRSGGLLALAACLPMAGMASAHHSTAAYDFARSVTIEGTVKSFQWANPHNYIQVLVRGKDGRAVEWAVEAGTPATATRQGWSKGVLKAGDKVKIIAAPMKDGSPGGTVKTITLPGGKTLQSVAADPNAAKPFEALPTLKRITPQAPK